jgi:hypothetical protein
MLSRLRLLQPTVRTIAVSTLPHRTAKLAHPSKLTTAIFYPVGACATDCGDVPVVSTISGDALELDFILDKILLL